MNPYYGHLHITIFVMIITDTNLIISGVIKIYHYEVWKIKRIYQVFYCIVSFPCSVSTWNFFFVWRFMFFFSSIYFFTNVVFLNYFLVLIYGTSKTVWQFVVGGFLRFYLFYQIKIWSHWMCKAIERQHTETWQKFLHLAMENVINFTKFI